jgi:hypothetical protein
VVELLSRDGVRGVGMEGHVGGWREARAGQAVQAKERKMPESQPLCGH